MQDSDDFFDDLDLDEEPVPKDRSTFQVPQVAPLSQRLSDGLLRFSQRTQRGSIAPSNSNSENIESRNKLEEFLKTKKVFVKQDENYKCLFHYLGEAGNTSVLITEFNKAFKNRELKNELLEVLENVTKEENHLKLYLSPIMTNNGEQETIFRCFLLCETIQTKIVEILMNNAELFATKPTSQSGQLAAACVQQIRYLENIYDADAFVAPIFEKEIEKWLPEPRDTFIECLPEVLVDPMIHGNAAQQLLDFILTEDIREAASFQSAILNTFCLLRIPEKIASQIRTSLCRNIMKFDVINLPEVIRFCIQTLSGSSSFSTLLKNVDDHLKIEELRKSRSSKTRLTLDDILINMFNVICRYVQLEGVRGWREISSFIRSFEGSDEDDSEPTSSNGESTSGKSSFSVFQMMLALALRSMEGCPNAVLNHFTNQSNNSQLKKMIDVCNAAMAFKKFNLKFLTSWMTVAKSCLYSPLKEVRNFGGFIYRKLFSSIEKNRHIIINSMMDHLSVSENEAETILTSFDLLVQTNIEDVLPFVPDLYKTFEIVDLLSHQNIKKLFKVFIRVYSGEEGQEELKRDIEELIAKMLCSINEKVRTHGILGLLVQLEHSLTEKNADREEVLKETLKKLTQSTRTSNSLRSLFYKQMAMIIKNCLKTPKSNVILDFAENLSTKFRKEFFIERPTDYVGFNDFECDKFRNAQSTLWLSASSQNIVEVVPTFELLKETSLLKRYWSNEDDSQVAVTNHFSSFFYAFEANIDLSDISDDNPEVQKKSADKIYHTIQWIRTLMNTFADQKEFINVSPETLESLWKQKFFLMFCCQRELLTKIEALKCWTTPSVPGDSVYNVVFSMKANRKRGMKRKDNGSKVSKSNDTMNGTKMEMNEDVEDDENLSSSPTVNENMDTVTATAFLKNLKPLKLSSVVRLIQYINQKRKATTFIMHELLSIFSKVLPKKDVKASPWGPKTDSNENDNFHGDCNQIFSLIIEATPTLWNIFNTANVFFRIDLDTSNVYDQDKNVFAEMVQLLQTVLETFSSILAWREISQKRSDSERIQRSRTKRRHTLMKKLEHSILSANNEQVEGDEAELTVLTSFISFAKSAPSIEVAVLLLDIMDLLNSWTPELKKKTARHALDYLIQEWSDSDRKALKGAALVNPVKSILSHYINLRPVKERLTCIQWLIVNKVAELLPDSERRKSKMNSYEDSADPILNDVDKNTPFFCFNKSTLYGIYKVLFSLLNATVSCYMLSSRSDDVRMGISTPKQVVAEWQHAANSFCLLGLILRVKSVRNAPILTAAVKEGRQFLNLIFHKNSSFICLTQDKVRARSIASDLGAVIKSVQIGNRTLQNIGVYAKTIKSVTLLKGLPDLRTANEMFMRTVQKVFVDIECHAAFEIGLLRSRNIDGEEIVNQEEEERESSGSPTVNNTNDESTENEREMSPKLSGVMKLGNPIALIRHYFKNLVTLCRNPTSIWFLLTILMHIACAFVLSIIFPLVVRHLTLPSSIQRDESLNVVFSPCAKELHGVCSHPSASLDVQKVSLFSPGITYSISVRLNFVDLEANQKMGLFQNHLAIYDENNNLLNEWLKTSHVKQPGILTKMIWLAFFPLYLTGFFHDYHTVEIFFSDDFFVSHNALPSKLVYTLQDRFAQVESASLLTNARFGLLRSFLYHWPLSSFFFLFIVSLSVCIFFILIYWGRRVYVSQQSEPANNEDEPPKANSNETVETSKNRFFDDVYVPDNVDEVPECPTFENFPCWNDTTTKEIVDIEPEVQTQIRKRKPI
ncbi:unnamed protein product [Auanema sp. JU1783]|nr:unnamed protein product [Auanema sp. JU1783]